MQVGQKEFNVMVAKVNDATPIDQDLAILIYRDVQKYLKTVSAQMDKCQTLKVDFSISINEVGDE